MNIMAVWKRKAIEDFPELRQDLQDAAFTPYMLFFELLPMVRAAHETENSVLLRKLYGYAAWCMDQNAEDLWNAAGVCFYEHLFDMSKHDWPKIIPWLSPTVIHACWSLWEARLDPPELEKLRQLIDGRTKHLYQDWHHS